MFGVGATDMAGVLVTGETWVRVPGTWCAGSAKNSRALSSRSPEHPWAKKGMKEAKTGGILPVMVS